MWLDSPQPGRYSRPNVILTIVGDKSIMVNTAELLARFAKLFPDETPMYLVRSPGRVNLIGEHVDYCDGYVLPIAMTQALWIVVAPRADGTIAVHSTAYNHTVSFPTADPGSPGEPFWANYIRGVAAMLVRRGMHLKGASLLIHSDVPVGGGVSSSAALETGVARALLAVAGEGIETAELALLCRQAEHEYAHSPCGIMDQFICGLGQADHALLLDCRSREYEQIPFELDGRMLVIINTQVKHEIGSSEYPRAPATMPGRSGHPAGQASADTVAPRCHADDAQGDPGRDEAARVRPMLARGHRDRTHRACG